MGVRSRVGGVFPEEGTACGEEGLERRAEGRPGGRRLVFGGRLASLCLFAPCAGRELGSRLENPGAKMQEKAKEIYVTFLSSKASSQVNVEGQSRLNEKILEEPHPLMFQKLQDQIFNLMKYDSYSRFLKSDLFLKHKRTEEEDEESPDAQTAAKRASRIYNT
ncbi:regulator of G-protein signaling 10 isoform X2 [Ovis aries]|uniref:regulator of G-protein signaling 10 isoform X2 n=1 Tax=Ovis aries TaxID=9940 RepID=UPI00100EFCA2|nr:regulator of G-protein signaling 10 isoform X2 [Ovis aries]